ncbi:TIR domain-containing protein [Lentzea sp. JNUCC 0626]|uniref:TIR domain-containing protein n=1 Tax=Lentzea sp. JNUCC 0626 TaxID=3367513 RepID=UPI003748EB3D
MSGDEEHEYDFDVAASYAGADRDEVLPILHRLAELEVRVYDREDRVIDNWGKNLVEHLPRIYQKRVRHGLLFISKHYLTDVLAKVERQAAQSRATELDEEFLLPVRLDGTRLPGLLPVVQHLDLHTHGREKICQAVVQKLAQHRSAFTHLTPVDANSIAALLREKPAGWKYLLYTAVIWQGWNGLEGKYRDHFRRYAPLNQAIEQGDGLESIDNRNILLNELITTTRDTFSDDKRKEVFGGEDKDDPNDIINLGDTFVRIFNDFLEWARAIHGTSYAREAAREASRLQASFADAQLRAMHSTVHTLRAASATLVERAVTGEEIDTGIDIAAVETSLESPLKFKISPELATAFLAALEQVKRRR